LLQLTPHGHLPEGEQSVHRAGARKGAAAQTDKTPKTIMLSPLENAFANAVHGGI